MPVDQIHPFNATTAARAGARQIGERESERDIARMKAQPYSVAEQNQEGVQFRIEGPDSNYLPQQPRLHHPHRSTKVMEESIRWEPCHGRV